MTKLGNAPTVRAFVEAWSERFEEAVRDAAGSDGRLSRADAEKISARSDDLAAWGDNAINYLEKTGQKSVSVDKLLAAGWRYAAREGDKVAGKNGKISLLEARLMSKDLRDDFAIMRGKKVSGVGGDLETGDPITLSLLSAPAGVTLERDGDVYTLRTAAPTMTWRDRAVFKVGDRKVEINGARGGVMTSNALSRGAPIDHTWHNLGQETHADGSTTQRFRFEHDPKAISEKCAVGIAREAIVAYLKSDRMDDRDWLNYFPDNWADAVDRGVEEGIARFGTDDATDEGPQIYKDGDIATYSSRGPFDLATDVSLDKYSGQVTRVYVEID